MTNEMYKIYLVPDYLVRKPTNFYINTFTLTSL